VHAWFPGDRWGEPEAASEDNECADIDALRDEIAALRAALADAKRMAEIRERTLEDVRAERKALIVELDEWTLEGKSESITRADAAEAKLKKAEEEKTCQKCESGAATARSLCDKCFSAGMEFGHAHPEYTPEKKP
jgi:hypothetical protein